MNEHSRSAGSVVPFPRRWHVIHEVDLARLSADHASLRALCDALEACADGLPARLSSEDVARLCGGLQTRIERHEAAEDAFLAALFVHDRHDPLTCALLDHVHQRQAADAAHALDLIVALQATHAAGPCGETLGYMLRCFFDGCRRAIDFEALVILTLGHARLTPEARAMLVEGLRARASG